MLNALAKPLAKWRSFPPRTKLAIGLGAVALFLWWRSSMLRSLTVIGQAYMPDGSHAPWAGLTLGNGPGKIGGEGCVFISLNNAWNLFNPLSTMTPDLVNELLKQAGAFMQDALVVATGAGALGINAPDTEHAKGVDVGTLRNMLDLALSRGGAALLRVFHGSDRANGDHTVLVYGGGGGSYIAADPALARNITFDGNLQSVDGTHWGSGVPYQGIGVQALYSA